MESTGCPGEKMQPIFVKHSKTMCDAVEVDFIEGPRGARGATGPEGPSGPPGYAVPAGASYGDYLVWEAESTWEVAGSTVHLGRNAGASGQGANAIAIGAADTGLPQGAHSIYLNASETPIAAAAGKCYMAPVRDGHDDAPSTSHRSMVYDTATKEVMYSDAVVLNFTALTGSDGETIIHFPAPFAAVPTVVATVVDAYAHAYVTTTTTTRCTVQTVNAALVPVSVHVGVIVAGVMP